MSDELEKYISQQRDQFEKIESLDEDRLWRNIQANRNGKQRSLHIYGIAASISLLVALVVSLYIWNRESTTGQNLIQSIDQEYQVMVGDRLSTMDPELLKSEVTQELLLDIKEVDQYKDELMEEASQYGDQDKILDLLRRYYERKLRMIELLEKEIQLQKNENEIINL